MLGIVDAWDCLVFYVVILNDTVKYVVGAKASVAHCKYQTRIVRKYI